MSDCETRVLCDCNECSTYRRGIAAGVADERARVVADLRARADNDPSHEVEVILNRLSDRYERGEHEETR